MTQARHLVAATAALAFFAFPALAGAKPADRDRDRMPDRWERKHKVQDAALDGDRDGLRNLGEYRAGTNPRRPDSDRDGVLDGHEDRDRDRVDNANEDRERTSPHKRDSDRDGVGDGREDADRDGLDNTGEDVTGNDPIDPDSDDDGVKDGHEAAGVVESFEEDVLVVRVVGGGTVRGLVTEATEIECGDEDPWSRALDATALRGDAEDGGGPDEGEDEWDGSDEPGEWEPEDPWDDESEDWESDCGTEVLVPGAGVHGAELELTGDGAVFTRLELVS